MTSINGLKLKRPPHDFDCEVVWYPPEVCAVLGCKRQTDTVLDAAVMGTPCDVPLCAKHWERHCER